MTQGSLWLLDEATLPDSQAIDTIEGELATEALGVRGPVVPNVAIQLHDIVIHDTKKWFGGADIRIDAIVVTAQAKTDKPDSFYQPKTFRFASVTREARLDTGGGNLLIFYGRPRHFLDLSISVSRDRHDSADLADLLQQRLNSTDFKAAAATVLAMTAVVSPAAAIVPAAIGAAATLGGIAFQVLQSVTGDSVGLYHNSLISRDNYGIGRHPSVGSNEIQGFSFVYEVVPDIAPGKQ